MKGAGASSLEISEPAAGSDTNLFSSLSEQTGAEENGTSQESKHNHGKDGNDSADKSASDDAAALRAERGISLLEEISRAMLLEEEAEMDDDVVNSNEDENDDKRKATVFDAKELEEMMKNRATPDSKRNNTKKAHRSWQQLDSLLETRAMKVSRDTLKESDIMVWAGTVRCIHSHMHTCTHARVYVTLCESLGFYLEDFSCPGLN